MKTFRYQLVQLHLEKWPLNQRETITYHSFQHNAEDDVPSVKPLSLCGCDEELRAVCVLAGICHRHPPSTVVLQLEVLISKLLSIDATTCTHATATNHLLAPLTEIQFTFNASTKQQP